MSTSTAPPPSVIEALDGFDWIMSWWQWWRELRRSHTQKRFAEDAGVAAGALPMVLARRYTPTPGKLQAFNRVFKLDSASLACLQALFEVHRAKDADARTAALARHQALQRAWQEATRPVLDPAFLREWENVILREAARRSPLPASAEAVLRRFRFPPPIASVRAALERLVASGLLVAHPEGGWTADRNAVDTGPVAEGVRELYRRAFADAAESLDRVPHLERKLGLSTLSFRAEDLPEIHARLWAFLEGLRDLADSTSAPDTVYLVGVQVVPLFDLRPVDEPGFAP